MARAFALSADDSTRKGGATLRISLHLTLMQERGHDSYEDSVSDHLSGTTNEPFEAGEHRRIAVKVIDDRGNDLLVVKELT